MDHSQFQHAEDNGKNWKKVEMHGCVKGWEGGDFTS